MKLANIIAKDKAKLIAVAQNAADDLAQRITSETPVDTGVAAQNWRTDGRVMSGMKHTNNTAYIKALEYGHSQQAPQGMVRVNIARWQQIVDSHA